MEWFLPVMIGVFVLTIHVGLERYYRRWSERIIEMDERNAEVLDRIRPRRVNGSGPERTAI